MDRKTVGGPVGVPLHPPIVHSRDVVQPDVRHRSYDSGWSRLAYRSKEDVQSDSKWRKSRGQPRFGQWAPRQEQVSRGSMQVLDSETLQHEGPTEEFS